MNIRKTFAAIFWTLPLCIAVSGQPDWHMQTSPIQDDLVSVSFADTLNGWAISDSGRIIHTIDGIQIFPNPATDHITVQNLGKGIEQIDLYSMQGKLITTSLVPRGQTKNFIDLRDLVPGTYILQAGETRRQLVIMQT